MSEEMQGFMIPDEPQVMSTIRSNMMTGLRAAVDGRHVPMPVCVNATATVMAHVAMLAILEYSEEVHKGQEFEQEAFRRILDAVASMEDWHARKSPWRLQSSALKKAEREGFAVRDVSEDKATKQ